MPVSSTHHKYSPSSIWNRLVSPCFVNKPAGEAAKRGTAQHSAVETGVDAALTDDELIAVDKVRKFLLPLEQHPDTTIRKELKLRVHTPEGELLTEGTCDYVATSARLVTLVDFKFGRQTQAPTEHNPQAWCHVVAAFQKWKKAETVRFVFVYAYLDEIDIHEWHREEYPDLLQRLEDGIEHIKAGEREHAETGAVWPDMAVCDYCLRLSTCPAHLPKADMVLADKKPVGFDPGRLAELTDPQSMGELMDAIRWVERDFAPAVKKHCLEQHHGGNTPSGYIPANGSSPRKIEDVVAAWSVVKELGVSLETFLSAASMTGGGLSRKLKGKEGEKVVDALVDHCLVADRSDFTYLRRRKG